MTIEEARNWFIQHHGLAYPDDKTTDYKVHALALDALEKQIPQKPWRDKYRTKCYRCEHNIPCVVRDGKMKYCSFCGQAIDWSE